MFETHGGYESVRDRLRRQHRERLVQARRPRFLLFITYKEAHSRYSRMSRRTAQDRRSSFVALKACDRVVLPRRSAVAQDADVILVDPNAGRIKLLALSNQNR